MIEFNMTAEDYTENNYFEYGVHKVTIEGTVLDKTDDGRAFVDIGVKGENGESDRARMWLHTEKAGKYTLRTIQGLCTHNAKTETGKDKVRNAFVGKIDEKKLRSFLDQMDGYEAWFKVEQDPTRTYVNSAGEERPSLNKDIYSYEPKPKKITVEDILPGAEESDDEVPFK